MRSSFQFHIPTQVVFQEGAAFQAAPRVKGDRVIILSTPFLFRSGVAQRIGESLAGKTVAYFSDIRPDPTCESVDAAAQAVREAGADCVIALGGGSTLDTAKAAACLADNPGPIRDYIGGDRRFSGRKTQLICVPATSGTGSEVTNVAVFTDHRLNRKAPMIHPLFWPDLALVDSALTLTLPPAVTAATGMDAFCHAIEAYWNREAQPISDQLSMEAMGLILGNLKRAWESPGDEAARRNMSLGSLLAGVAFSQTRTTGVHALSFPLTMAFGLSHGEACALTLPAFIRISGEKEEAKMQRLVVRLGFADRAAFADAVEALIQSMGMPTRLGQAGATDRDLPGIVDVGLKAAVIHLTPAEMNAQTVAALLRSIL